MAWRDSFRPASFRGISFHVDGTSRAGGRRGQTYEFPKRDSPADEDLGRRAKRFSISGYVIGLDHHAQADRLEAALNAEGPGQLITQLMGALRVRCDVYTRTERRQEGGLTFFAMTFSEAGSTIASRVAESTQAQVQKLAIAANGAVAAGANAGAAAAVSLKPLPPIMSTVAV